MHAFSTKFLQNMKAGTSWRASKAAGWPPAAYAPCGAQTVGGQPAAWLACQLVPAFRFRRNFAEKACISEAGS